MNLGFKTYYALRKTALSIWGPATLDRLSDPMAKLERERDRRLGARPPKPAKEDYIPQRHLNSH